MVILADLLLITHFLFVAFVVVSVPLIALGGVRNWKWVRNFWFRLLHLFAIAFVAGESLIGVFCPLTVWEQELRRRSGGAAYEGSFIEHWISRALYWEFAPWVFTVAYVTFAALVLILYRVIPPFPRRVR